MSGTVLGTLGSERWVTIIFHGSKISHGSCVLVVSYSRVILKGLRAELVLPGGFTQVTSELSLDLSNSDKGLLLFNLVHHPR